MVDFKYSILWGKKNFKKSCCTMGLLSFIVIAQQFLFVIAATLPARQEKGKL